MALRLYLLLLFLIIFSPAFLQAQTIYYPKQSSELLKSSANDMAALFSKAMPGSHFTVQEYSSLPQSGIILIYDSSMINNQSCKIEGNAIDLLQFSAAQDAGLCYGIYNYLDELGFRFYLPGEIWEKTPMLSSVFKKENVTLAQKFKYNTWFISGGYNKWIMDKTDGNGGDFGINGFSWSRYQLRNNMLGAYRFSGHRGDVFTEEYISTLKKNPCFIACNNGERKAGYQSVPDINNSSAMSYWAANIFQRYNSYKKTICSDPNLYKNLYHNFNYGNDLIGIEVADGSSWGNSKDNNGCFQGNFNGDPYPSVSDQQFVLANFTAAGINNVSKEKHFQCYAYSGHANVPSSNIAIDKNIDVQVIASAFQTETSAVALLNRWYIRHSNISEYEYVNIPQWTGETPIFSLQLYKNTLARLKQYHSQGLVTEASPAKFASLPFLLAGNRYLEKNVEVDNTLNDFLNDMFPEKVAVHIKTLLNYWGENNVMQGGEYISDNRFKIPLFVQLLDKAVAVDDKKDANVTARLQELKAYLHYIILYYDFTSDSHSAEIKKDKAAKLCAYLAKINKLQLVNSYFLILDLVNKYSAANDFYKQYNVIDGSVYQNGNLPAITNQEINNNFLEDIFKYSKKVTDFKFENAIDIIGKIKSNGLQPLDKIKVGIGYTMGLNYANRCEFYFYAPSAGSVHINCDPIFELPGNGYLNFAVEAVDKPLLVIKDVTISPQHTIDNFDVIIAQTGLYRLTVITQFKTSVNLTITTNGNIFFKQGSFYGKRAENYHSDALHSMPKYFYVPDISNIYFSINNGCYTGKCLSGNNAATIFGIKDNEGKKAIAENSPDDSMLYKMVIPSANANKFWQVTQMREYNFSFANISNIEIFAQQKPEAAPLPSTNNEVIVYPNPSTNIFNFKRNNSSLIFDDISIYDPQGKKIVTSLKTASINLEKSPPGIYIFSAKKDNEWVKGKLVKY